jgi:hypothetical protein
MLPEIALYKETLWFLYSSGVDLLPQTNCTMRFAILSALGICASVLAQSGTVDTYISTESPVAKAGLLANIGPYGSKSAGAKVSLVSALDTLGFA